MLAHSSELLNSYFNFLFFCKKINNDNEAWVRKCQGRFLNFRSADPN